MVSGTACADAETTANVVQSVCFKWATRVPPYRFKTGYPDMSGHLRVESVVGTCKAGFRSMTKSAFSLVAMLIATLAAARSASPGNAPQLPITGTRIVNVSTEPQLQAAMSDLRTGDTILLADGVYNLTSSLYVNGRNDVTIRGTSGSTNVVLSGKGMNNSNYGNAPFGIWSNGANTTIAHLTLRETWDNEIIFNTGAQSPRVYCVQLIDAGSQFIKSNPTDVNAGIGVNDGVVEYCVFEYTGTPPNDHGAGVGYFNGISAHAARNWIVRGNLFKNLHNPDGTAYSWNPSVLFWRNSSNTITERNVFINVDRAVAYGLDDSTPYFDHAGGVVRNNFIYLAPGFLGAARKASSDGSIIAWNSPGTQVDHNTALLNGNEFYAVEFRFARTTNCAARNNLTDAPLHLRDSAGAVLNGNLTSAGAGMFVNPAEGDLHLLPTATQVIDKAPHLNTVTNDFDGERRPRGGGADVGADEFSTDLPPVVNSLMRNGNFWEVRFRTFLGESYDVETADAVPGAAWALVGAEIPGDGQELGVKDIVGTGRARGFYRVRLSP
jgi:hypothetical protein